MARSRFGSSVLSARWMVLDQVRPVGVDPGRHLGGLVGHGVADAEADVGHDVAHEDGARLEALGGQVPHGDVGRGQAQVGGVVGEDAVVLLGHAPVEGAQAGLEVGQGEVQLHRGQRARERGVRVAVDQHPVGAVLVDHRVQRREDAARLDAVRAGADAEVDVRCGDLQVGEEDVRHQGVVVLAGVDDDVVVARRLQGCGDRCQLHELRPGANDAEDLHVPCSFRWEGGLGPPLGLGQVVLRGTGRRTAPEHSLTAATGAPPAGCCCPLLGAAGWCWLGEASRGRR